MKTDKKNYIAEVKVVSGGFVRFAFKTIPEAAFVAALRIAKAGYVAWSSINIYRKTRKGFEFMGVVYPRATFSIAMDWEKNVATLSVADVATAVMTAFTF